MFGLEKILFLGKTTQGAGNILSDRRLLGDDELFGHGR
jgi:hypothetical protein